MQVCLLVSFCSLSGKALVPVKQTFMVKKKSVQISSEVFHFAFLMIYMVFLTVGECNYFDKRQQKQKQGKKKRVQKIEMN